MRVTGFDGFQLRGELGGGHAGLRAEFASSSETNPQPLASPTEGGGPLFAGDDIADDISTTTSISVGGTLNSSIQSAGDLDYVRVSLVAGQAYTISLDGQTMVDSYVELRDSAGVLVAENDDGGIQYDSFLMYTAATTGDYFIVARGYDGSNIGTYSLTVDTVVTGLTSPTAYTPNSLPYFSWEQAAIQISRSGQTWGTDFGASAVVTYAYRSSAPATMPSDTAGFTVFSVAQIAATEAALAAWAAVANITFVRVDSGGGYSNNATMLFGNYSSGEAGAAAFAYLPGDAAISSITGDVWVNSSISDNSNPVAGGYGRQVLLHEIGHALGLSHPGDYNAGGMGGDPTYPGSAVFYADTRMFTVMSYFASVNTGGAYNNYASLPQLYDISAMQRLYGANLASRAGDTIYGFNSNTGVPEYALTLASQGAVFAVWDGGGIDTLDFSGYTTANMIDLRAESFSSVGPRIGGTGLAHFNVAIGYGVTIENAIGGSGDDIIIGNDANNIIDGRAGVDSMTGGGGDDTYYVNSFFDGVFEAAGAGTDTVNSTIVFTLPTDVENLTLIGGGTPNGTGNGLNNIITGNDQNNTLSGLDGNDTVLGAGGVDTLLGGIGNDSLDGGAGADAMSGGDGDDSYLVDDAGDTVTESSNQGTDAVSSGVSFTLGANVEHLTLTGVDAINGTGNALNNTINGNDFANVLTGDAGADSLFGFNGDDTLNGGADNDALDGGNDADTLNGGDGVDTLLGRSGIDTLNGDAGNDSLNGGDGDDTLNGGGDDDLLDAGNNNDTLNGGDGADQLYGRAGIDTLDGGLGADTMFGGAGDDTYVVDDAGDLVGESASAGTDTILSSVTRGLGQYQENLTLTGLAAIDGSGNILANTINGNDAANVLSGLAGFDTLNGNAGADSLNGGNGNDTLNGGADNDILDGGNDLDTLNGGDGVDTLYGRTSNDTLGGDAGNDTLYGGDGDDTMSGGTDDDLLDGGNHNDILNGGDGTDTLYGRQNNDALNGDAGTDTLYGGDGDDTLNGGADADFLDAGNGDDTLDGGLGADTLIGGAGADAFVFSTALGGGNVDTITTFIVADDVIRLDIGIFTAIGAGVLDTDAFVIGSVAADAEDRIVYNSSTGALSYDADGNGAGVAVQFATLTTGLALTNNDFFGFGGP